MLLLNMIVNQNKKMTEINNQLTELIKRLGETSKTGEGILQALLDITANNILMASTFETVLVDFFISSHLIFS